MRTLVESYKNTGLLHHAYAIAGPREAVRKSLLSFLEDTVGIVTVGNPDVQDETYDTFGIDEARKVRGRQTTNAAVRSAQKIFIMAATVITHEAQNALLKIFEEPTRDTHFFLIVPDMEMLLPTLCSRLVVIPYGYTNDDTALAAAFLKSDMGERFAAIKDMVENKNRLAAIVLLDALEIALHASFVDAKKIAEHAFVFSEIANCRAYLHGRAPSLKLILEHLALIIPRIS
ncbi:MAG: hypothetical protein HZC04_01280 [Candidatus Lloydbacteria bacterium]|nr:hypothetical protein [Candidatus Lloydbacteria bacterium]